MNVKNYDNECFYWCHIRHLNPLDKNPQRITTKDREFIKELYYSGISFPVTIKQIYKIQKQNLIGISVFGYSKEALHPNRISSEK